MKKTFCFSNLSNMKTDTTQLHSDPFMIFTAVLFLPFAQSLSCVQLFVTPWTIALQAPLSMGILQARILEWVAISFSRGSAWPRDPACISCIGRQILYHRATWEALPPHSILFKTKSGRDMLRFSSWNYQKIQTLLWWIEVINVVIFRMKLY